MRYTTKKGRNKVGKKLALYFAEQYFKSEGVPILVEDGRIYIENDKHYDFQLSTTEVYHRAEIYLKIKNYNSKK
jgi:hypothetical protein